MRIDRLDQNGAEQRLKLLPNLKNVLGDKWIADEYKKQIENWSLINGWISSSDKDLWNWLVDLDYALGYLNSCVKQNVFRKIATKIKTHSDRANSKGTLSEIAVMMFLVSKGIVFDLERRLTSNGKNVDICANITKEEPLYIEVQWLSPSDLSERGATIASAYGEAYSMDFEAEELRIKQKVFDKTPKFTRDDMTFVALDCTTAPELGGRFMGAPIGSAIYKAFTGESIQGKKTSFSDSVIDVKIREFVDGVIWFQLLPGNNLFPLERGIYINPLSPHRNKDQITIFVTAQTPTLQRAGSQERKAYRALPISRHQRHESHS